MRGQREGAVAPAARHQAVHGTRAAAGARFLPPARAREVRATPVPPPRGARADGGVGAHGPGRRGCSRGRRTKRSRRQKGENINRRRLARRGEG